MMTTNHLKTAVIIGAGPGLGNHIAAKFASEGYQIILVSRKKEKLEGYVRELMQAGYEVIGVPADAADPHSLKKAFKEIRNRCKEVDTLIYNAADLNQKPVQELTGKELTEHFKTDVAGALDCVQEVMPAMLEKKQGTILFTGGLLGVFPYASYKYACISIDKAALRTLAQMLNQYLENSGVFAGIVNVMGNVGSGQQMDPAMVAEAFWTLAQQRESFELDYPPLFKD